MRVTLFAGLFVLFALPSVPVAHAETPILAKQISPLFSCLSGDSTDFTLSCHLSIEIDGRLQLVDIDFTRRDDRQFDLSVQHPDYSFRVHRRDDFTAFALPHHQTVYVGAGAVDEVDNLVCHGIADRLIGSGTTVSTYLPIIRPGNGGPIITLLTTLLELRYDEDRAMWVGKDGMTLRFPDDAGGGRIECRMGTTELSVNLQDQPRDESLDWSQWKRVELTRRELERQLARGARRTLEVLAPSRQLTSPAQRNRRTPNGELRWIDGQRVVLLNGTPEQIGKAHGQLLKGEASRCIDSVLYAFGTVQTIRTGRWFRDDLESAYQRLAAHIPEHHKRETRALAQSLAMDPALIETINVFPELFHCSGFAVFGEATRDGKLYHGRVLDYMTTIGLQDSATTFIVAADGKIPFANVGYAGFIGSVTGMNAASISLGEMGGGGEGQWDGVPMATLMRRALEECSTLAEVRQLWRESPRTCEYFYVFADGKTNEAVGVAALPESIEFILPGQADDRLGPGIPDAVVLSAGDRLTTLRERVQSRYGQIDVDAAQWLMSRPVAMQSNLHNALFVPADGVFFVANASHDRPAAECHYVRYDLNELVETMRSSGSSDGAQ